MRASAWVCSLHQDASVHGPSVADIKKCGTQSMEFVCPCILLEYSLCGAPEETCLMKYLWLIG